MILINEEQWPNTFKTRRQNIVVSHPMDKLQAMSLEYGFTFTVMFDGRFWCLNAAGLIITNSPSLYSAVDTLEEVLIWLMR